MISRSLGFSVGVAAWLTTGIAVAEGSPRRVSLRWAAPEECPDDVQLVHEVETLLGQSLPDVGERLLTVRVNVQGSKVGGYAAKLAFTSERGSDERFLEHPSCENLVHAVALVVALAIDPERVGAVQRARDAAGQAPAQEPTTPEPPAVPTSDVVRPARAPAVSRSAARPMAEPGEPLRGMRVALHGLGGAGPLPSFGVGLEAALGWHRESFRAEVLGRYWLPRQTAVSFDPSATLELGLMTAGVRACWLPLSGAWQFAACGGGDLGDARADGLGVENEHTRHARYSDFVGGFQVAYARSRLAPEGGLELAAALERPRFGVLRDGQGAQVFQPAAWAFSAFLGLAFEL